MDEKDQWWFSVYDFINFVCDKKPKCTYAKTTFQRLTKHDSEYAKDIDTFCVDIKFALERQKNIFKEIQCTNYAHVVRGCAPLRALMAPSHPRPLSAPVSSTFLSEEEQ